MSSIAGKADIAGLEQLLPSRTQLSMSRRFEQVTTAAEAFADFIAAAAGLVAGYYLYRALHLGRHLDYPASMILAASATFALVFVLMLDREGAYRQGHGLLRIRQTERTLRVSMQAFFLLLPVLFFSGRLISRLSLAFAFVLVPLLVGVEKQIFFAIIRSLHARGRGVRKVVLYGAGLTGKRVFSALVRLPKLGLDPVVIVDDDEQNVGSVIFADGYKRERSATVVGGPITPELVRSVGAEAIVVTISNIGRERFAAAASAAEQSGATLAYVPSELTSADEWVEYADLDGLLLAMLVKPGTKMFYKFIKRLFDVVFAVVALLVTAPVLIAAAIAVRLDSQGPALFTQERVGKNGRLFEMYKFRSMRTDAPQYGYSPTESVDPRITRVGRFLRKTSIDELPQLWNVIRGEMSLVGPRPEMPFIVAQYGARERQRLGVTPGITGLWQLSADRAFQIHENIHYDLYYIRHRGFFIDMAILLHTIFFAINGV